MQSIKKATLYGFLLYFLWLCVIFAIYVVLPEEIAKSAFFVTIKMVLLAGFTLWFTLHYMKKVDSNSFTTKEGIALGVYWAIIALIADAIHYMLMGVFQIGAFLLTIAPAYIMLPLITIMLMKNLKLKK